jgi:hypothetical protein
MIQTICEWHKFPETHPGEPGEYICALVSGNVEFLGYASGKFFHLVDDSEVSWNTCVVAWAKKPAHPLKNNDTTITTETQKEN